MPELALLDTFEMHSIRQALLFRFRRDGLTKPSQVAERLKGRVPRRNVYNLFSGRDCRLSTVDAILEAFDYHAQFWNKMDALPSSTTSNKPSAK